MKALLDRVLLIIAAVSVAGVGVYYVSSASEPVAQGSCGGDQKAPWHCGYNVTIQ